MLQEVFGQARLVLLFQPRLFFFLALRLGEFADVGLFLRLVGLKRHNFFRRSPCKLSQQYTCRKMYREILGFSVRQRTRVNAQVVELALKQAACVLIAYLEWRGCTEGAVERVFYDLD